MNSLIPSNERSSISKGITNRRSASSGEMPSWMMVTTKKGTWMFGSLATGMAARAARPASTTISSTSTVVLARLMAASMMALMRS